MGTNTLISHVAAIARLVEVLESARLRPRMYFGEVIPKTCIDWLAGLRAGFAISTLDWPAKSRWRVLIARGLEFEARYEDEQLAGRGLGPEEIVDELLAIEIDMWKGMTLKEIEAAARPPRPIEEWLEGSIETQPGDRFVLNKPTRETLVEVLGKLCEICPEYRFGQMIANLAMLARGDAEGAVYDLEDEELVVAARKHLEDWSRRQVPVARK